MRANVKDLRAVLILAETFAKHGVLFVPMPVADAKEFEELKAKAWQKLDEIEAEAEQRT